MYSPISNRAKRKFNNRTGKITSLRKIDLNLKNVKRLEKKYLSMYTVNVYYEFTGRL